VRFRESYRERFFGIFGKLESIEKSLQELRSDIKNLEKRIQ